MLTTGGRFEPSNEPAVRGATGCHRPREPAAALIDARDSSGIETRFCGVNGRKIIRVLNAEFTQRIVLDTTRLPWQASPVAGIERRPLDRVGGEVARATSLVRYAAGSAFSAHAHGGGEEFFVLDGVFSDEHGDYPAGHYVRNPPGSLHAPRSQPGCSLWVKLWQFAPGDHASLVVDAWRSAWQAGASAGLTTLPLHAHGETSIALVRCAPHLVLEVVSRHTGEELFVLEGSFADEQGEYAAGTWLRDPRPARRQFVSGPRGALLLVRVGRVDAPTLWDARGDAAG